ncbi:hypothetical protein [Botryobacter ruber]|uniref:hypothetical protein n=1 Tax=Botryobacter ruber TaxID=2171629 RepID=UPI000F645B57|nr:hypothetical protein [Botryobacter ruber]
MKTCSYLDGETLFGSMHAYSSFSSNLTSGSEVAEYSTIDGRVITHTACAHAVSNGSGIFIGDYFVGLTESNTLFGNTHFIRY